MSAYTLTEQVEALIAWAYQHASKTGKRQRVKAIKGPHGWYYQTCDTLAWPRRMVKR